MLTDECFVDAFALATRKYWLDLALYQRKESITCSGWGTLGLHYFNDPSLMRW